MLGYQRKNELWYLRKISLNLIPNSVCAIVWNVLSTQKIENEIWHKKDRRKILLTWRRRVEFCLSSSNKSCVRTVDVSYLCITLFTVRRGKKGQRQFTNHFVSWITGIKTNMLLIIFLGIMAKLTSVSGDCYLGSSEMNSFDCNQVCNVVMTRFLQQSSFKYVACIYNLFVVPLKNSQ